MTTFNDRLREAFAIAHDKDPKITKTRLATFTGVTPSAVSAWFSGQSKSISPENVSAVAKYLGVSERWLANGTGEMTLGKVHEQSDDIDEDLFVRIPEYAVTFSCGDDIEGDGITYDELTDTVDAYYSREFFQKRGINPENCKVFITQGDSMEPLICDGDRILVDTSPQDIISGKIYAFLLHGKLRVKFLYPLLRGGIQVHSYNENYPDETLTDEDLDTFRLIGRVRDRSGGDFF